ncbi:MAG: PilZ domain-containing protein [Gammaproteobacteria bacterium]|nr:PilZ domain-containing protein [Gammaproteobacteria bacterium]
MADKQKHIVNHYKSVGRHGKQLVEEDVKAGSDTAKFLERMEQRRLASPCYIAIDMRGKVEQPCKPYQFEGLTHYLDKQCISIFEQETQRYDGKYTVGVFEAVQAADHTFKAQHEREQQRHIEEQKKKLAAKPEGPKDPLFQKKSANDTAPTEPTAEPEQEPSEEHSIRLIPFGYRAQRKQDRLNYVTDVSVKLTDGKELKAKTSDISTSGIKVTFFGQVAAVAEGSVVSIKFDALAKQFTLDLDFVEFELIEQTLDHHGRSQFRLARADQSEHEHFNIFMDEFIKSHQSRYKLELEDSLLSLYAKAFERIYNAGTGHAVSLLQRQPSGFDCLYTATRPVENGALKNAMLSAIAENLIQLCPTEPPATEGRSFLIEAFVVKGHTLHRVYCANRNTLVANKHFDEFLKVGSQAHLIARIHLKVRTINEIDRSSAADLLQPLSEEAPHRFESIKSRWNKVTHIAYYQIIEEKLTVDSRLTGQSAQLTGLQDYQMPSGTHQIWQLAYRNERKDPRYLYKTAVEIPLGKDVIKGETLDFSPAGMRIKLAHLSNIPMALDINNSIKVSLPEMQKLAKKTANLKDLPYRVTQWHPHDLSISVRRDYSVKSHDGESFFTRLINSNKDKLKLCPEDLEYTLVASMIEALVSGYLSGIPLFIRRFSGGRYAIDSAAATENANDLLWQFKTGDSFDFSALNLEAFFSQVLRGNLNRRSQLTHALNQRLFAVFPSDASQPLSIRDESEFADNREVAKFILMTRKNPNYRILRAQFLPPPFIKLEEFKDDLAVIRSNSSNRARQFEQNVQQLVAMVDIEDITAFYQ